MGEKLEENKEKKKVGIENIKNKKQLEETENEYLRAVCHHVDSALSTFMSPGDFIKTWCYNQVLYNQDRMMLTLPLDYIIFSHAFKNWF